MHAADRHRAVFHRLPQHFQRPAIELGELVEEQNPVVRQRYLARRGNGTSADKARVADRMMRIAERTNGQQRMSGRQQPQGAVDARGLDRLTGRQIGQNGRHALSKHRLAGTRGTEH